MKGLLVFFILITAASFTFAQEVSVSTGGSETNKKAKVLILPLKNKSNERVFVSSGLVRAIIFHSFYTFIGIIPSVNVPDDTNMLNLTADEKNVSKLAEEENADIIIYGDYQFKGTRANPSIKTELRIYSRNGNTNILKKEYLVASTGAEIFDTIDEMISDSVKSALNIEVNIANIFFEKFKTGRDQYELYVNGKLISPITNDGFNYNLKILPDNDYKVQIKRLWDQKFVLEALANLKSYKSITISYAGLATVKVNGIAYKDRNKNYQLFLDNKPVNENDIITNMPAGRNHVLKLTETNEGVVENQTFYVKDGENRDVTPSEKSSGIFHIKAIALDRSFATLGADLFWGRYFWFGVGAGASYSTLSTGTVYFISPYVEAGYYFLGDINYDFRIGAGIQGRVNMYFPENPVRQIDPSIQNYMPNLGIFGQLEWKFIILKPTLYLYWDQGNIGVSYGIGAGFRI